MKIIGLILLAIGVIGIVLTILLPAELGYGGLVAGATAILTGIVFVAATTCRVANTCERRNSSCC